MAFYKLEPFGPLHSDEQFGTLCALVANMMRGSGTEMMFADAFFPSLDPRTDEQKQKDAAELLRKRAAFAAMMSKGDRANGRSGTDRG